MSRRPTATATVEPLETRTLCAFTTDTIIGGGDDGPTSVDSLFEITHRGTLVVKGTDRADFIRVTARRNGVSLQFSRSGVFVSIGRSQFRRLRVEAGGGNDDVAMVGQLGKPLTINGGTGHDRLTGGTGSETINGGAGNDTIRAFAAADTTTAPAGTTTVVKLVLGTDTEVVGSLLTGGRGDDTITGSPGHDTINGSAGRDVFRLEVFGETPIFRPGDSLPQGDDELNSIETTVFVSASAEVQLIRGTLKLP